MVLINVFAVVIGLQTGNLHGTWRCHFDETIWRDPEMVEISGGYLETITYYGWGFMLSPDGNGKYVSIGDQFVEKDNNAFIYSQEDSVLHLGYSEYIIEKLDSDTLVIRNKRYSQMSVVKRYILHKEDGKDDDVH